MKKLKEELRTNKGEVKSLSKTKSSLETNVDYLETLLKDNQSDKLCLFDTETRGFSKATELCVYGLLNANVAFEKVPDVIQHMASLCGKASIDRLPSEATIREMNKRRLSLSHMQIAETVTGDDNLCLLSDETPDRGATVEGFHVATEEGNMFVLGLRHMANKAAGTTLDTFKEILEDISQVETGATDAGKKILASIASTMSDQAATQKSFNDLLQNFKTSIMPEMVEKWEEMSPNETAACSKINNFFCGLHLLINMAEVANQVLKKYESASEEIEFGARKAKPGESGTVRFIRTACKALGKRGDSKSGAYSHFRDYIFAKLKENLRLEPFHGNRFNTLFLNAGLVFYYREDIVDFLENSVKERNRLLLSVLEDAKVPVYIAAAKALGLVEKFITSPLWRLIESKCHILDMNDHYRKLLSFLQETSKDAMPFISGNSVPFPDQVIGATLEKTSKDLQENTTRDQDTGQSATRYPDTGDQDIGQSASRYPVTGDQDTGQSATSYPDTGDQASHISSRRKWNDLVAKKLTRETDYDSEVVEILQLLFSGWASYLSKAVKPHLEGGEYDKPTDDIRKRITAAPKHNKFSEAVFGILHNLTTHRPNASVLANEAYIMFSLNRTLDWLNQKPEDERKKLMKNAKKLGHKLQQRFQSRQKVIIRKRCEALERERQTIERSRQRALQEKERLTNDIVFYGLWQTEGEVVTNSRSFKSKKDWQKAFAAQLKFRKVVLRQEHSDKTLFNLSKDRKDFTLDHLKRNLIQLISSTFETKKETDVIRKGNPLLVGKKVVHTFDEENERTDYHGTVIDTVRGFPDWYNIVYEGDDAVYTYRLQEDYERGELRLVVEEASSSKDP